MVGNERRRADESDSQENEFRGDAARKHNLAALARRPSLKLLAAFSGLRELSING